MINGVKLIKALFLIDANEFHLNRHEYWGGKQEWGLVSDDYVVVQYPVCLRDEEILNEG